MRITSIRTFAFAAGLTAVLLCGGVPARAADVSCASLQTIATPNVTTADGQLNAVAALSPSNVWAVGTSHAGALIEHFDGTHWTIIQGANEGRYATLVGVAAILPTDVWVIGNSSGSPFSERWNGRAWQNVPVPVTGGDSDSLNALAAISARDMWAVGRSYDKHTLITDQLIEHWNGSSWRIVPDPTGSHFRPLAIAALSADDIWVGGERRYDESAVAEHWNGRRWTVSATPVAGQLDSLSASSPSDIWAVGGVFNPDDTLDFNSLIEHWNGHKWSASRQRISDAVLTGVAAISPNDAWAVGRYGTPTAHGRELIEHWNGRVWSIAKTPSVPVQGDLNAISAGRHGDLWAVGRDIDRYGGSQPVAQRESAGYWTPTAPAAVDRPNGFLSAISTVSPTDVWAAGGHRTATGVRAVVDHFDGKSWNQTMLPLPAWLRVEQANIPWGEQVFEGSNFYDVSLNAIAAISPSDVWVAGFAQGLAYPAAQIPLIEHWNGKRWQISSIPVGSGEIEGLLAFSSGNIWAVGSNKAASQPLMVHWNGKTWKTVISPDVSGGSLTAISAVGTSDIWAVGTKLVYCEIDNCVYTLAEHWNGSKWSVTPTQSPLHEITTVGFLGVASVGPADIWAGGQDIEHWNGKSWSEKSMPRLSQSYIQALSGSGPRDVWALIRLGGNPTIVMGTAVDHWDGSSWQRVTLPAGGIRTSAMLTGLASREGQTWAVGSRGNLSIALHNPTC